MTASARIMGPAFVNSRGLSAATGIIAALVLAINTYLVSPPSACCALCIFVDTHEAALWLLYF